MSLSPVFLKQFKDAVEHILHVPGNYRGNVLEMTVVVDGAVEKEAAEVLPQLLRALKMHSKVFLNVRFHYVSWQSDEKMEDRVCPMTAVMLSSFYEDYEQIPQKKRLEILAEYLKKFHARSKLIILLAGDGIIVEDRQRLEGGMQPFLGRKMMMVRQDANGWNISTFPYDIP